MMCIKNESLLYVKAVYTCNNINKLMDDDSQTQKNKTPNKQGLVIKMQQLHQKLRINRRNDYQINNRK